MSVPGGSWPPPSSSWPPPSGPPSWGPPQPQPGWGGSQGWHPPQTSSFAQTGWQQSHHYGHGYQGLYTPQQPRSGGGGACCGVVAVVLLLGVVGFGFMILAGVLAVGEIISEEPTRQPTPTQTSTPTPSPTPAPTPTPTPTPSPTPTPYEHPQWQPDPLPAPHSDHPAWVTLQQAPIYSYDYPELTGCRPITPASTLQEHQQYLSDQLDCTQRSWQPILQQLGLSTHTVPHFFYHGNSITTPCGTIQAPAAYCSADGGSIYFGDPTYRSAQHWPSYPKIITGHEYGHHLQASSGMWRVDHQVIHDSLERSRRTELQAECLGVAVLEHDTSVVWDRQLFDSVAHLMRSGTSHDTHGSPDAKSHWGLRGLYLHNIGEACNTYVVGANWVR